MAVQRPQRTDERPAWTIAEAKAKLSEILRLSESEGPQRIGARKRYVVVPEDVWLEREPEPRPSLGMPLGQWLVENLRGLGPYPLVDRSEDSDRPLPYADWTEEEWAEFEATDANDS